MSQTKMLNKGEPLFLGHDLDSQKLLTNLLKKLQKLHYYRLEVSISQALGISNVAPYNPF